MNLPSLGYKKTLNTLLLAWVALLFFEAFRFGINKFYSIDEFQYAHAAWLVSKGFVPYRDFFDHHFPFLYQLASPIFFLSKDNPSAMALMRWFMIPWWAWMVISLGYLNRRVGMASALLGIAFLLSMKPFLERATEFRPDVLAFSFFVGALVLVSPRTHALGKWHLFFSGILMGACLWSSQKAFYYAWIFLMPFVLKLFARRFEENDLDTFRTIPFTVGLASVFLSVLLYLVGTKSFSPWMYWCIYWARIHQSEYPGFVWTRYFSPVFRQYYFVFLLAGFMWAQSIRNWLRGERVLVELFLLLSWPSTFCAAAFQRAAYPYSFIPFYGISCLFAGRTVYFVEQLISKRKFLNPLSRVATTVLLGIAIVWNGINGFLSGRVSERESNHYQRNMLKQIAELAGPGRAVYDNSGSYVAGPHVHFFFYTDSLLRQKLASELVEEIPSEIERKECTLMIRDLRFNNLPEELKEYLNQNYQPFSGEIGIWGRRYQKENFRGVGAVDFYAVTSGSYFIWPNSAVGSDRVSIDNSPITKPVFELEKGLHTIRYAGSDAHFFVMWLPDNKKMFEPTRTLRSPQFSRLFD